MTDDDDDMPPDPSPNVTIIEGFTLTTDTGTWRGGPAILTLLPPEPDAEGQQ